MENNTALKQEKNSNMSEKEFLLIQALIKEKIEKNEELEFEKFDGYELPPSTQFSMLKKPTVTIKYGKIRFNMAAIKLFSGIKYILPMLHGDKKRLAAVPCLEEKDSSVEWARIRKKDNAWVNKDISSVDFVNKIFNIMGWKKDCRYKIIGRIADSERGLILIFDLEEAIRFEPAKKEVVNPLTGKTSIVNEKYYPDKYKDRIGKSYNDYAASELNSSYEDLMDYNENSSVHNTFCDSIDQGALQKSDSPEDGSIEVSSINNVDINSEANLENNAEYNMEDIPLSRISDETIGGTIPETGKQLSITNDLGLFVDKNE